MKTASRQVGKSARRVEKSSGRGVEKKDAETACRGNACIARSLGVTLVTVKQVKP